MQIIMHNMIHPMGKPTIYIRKNKGADQLCSNCEADRRLCFRYMDSTIPLLSKSKISRLQPSSVLVQLGLCQTWSETTLLVFPRGGSYICSQCCKCSLQTKNILHFKLLSGCLFGMDQFEFYFKDRFYCNKFLNFQFLK